MIRAAMVALTLVLATACGGDSGTGPGAGIEGRYDLVSIDGQAMPATTAGWTFHSGFLQINGDNTWSDSSTMSGFGFAPFTATDQGLWTRNGNTITFSYYGSSGTDVGSILNNGDIAWSSTEDGGTIYQYRR